MNKYYMTQKVYVAMEDKVREYEIFYIEWNGDTYWYRAELCGSEKGELGFSEEAVGDVVWLTYEEAEKQFNEWRTV